MGELSGGKDSDEAVAPLHPLAHLETPESITTGEPTGGYSIYLVERRVLSAEGRARFEAGEISDPGNVRHPTHEDQRIVETDDGPMLEELRLVSSLKVEADPERQGVELVGLVREIFAEAHHFYADFCRENLPAHLHRRMPALPGPADLPVEVHYADYFARFGD